MWTPCSLTGDPILDCAPHPSDEGKTDSIWLDIFRHVVRNDEMINDDRIGPEQTRHIYVELHNMYIYNLI